MIIHHPVAQAVVNPNFTVRTVVKDDVGVTKVELVVDGKVLASRGTPPFDFPVSLKPGPHTIVVKGHDAAGNRGQSQVSFSVKDTSTPKTPTPGKGGYGMPCTAPEQCQSSICANDLTLQQQYCTQTCNPQDPGCPVDSECLSAAGGAWICAPAIDTGVDGYGNSPGFSTGGGMSCAVDSEAPPDPWLGLLALLLLLGACRAREPSSKNQR